MLNMHAGVKGYLRYSLENYGCDRPCAPPSAYWYGNIVLILIFSADKYSVVFCIFPALVYTVNAGWN